MFVMSCFGIFVYMLVISNEQKCALRSMFNLYISWVSFIEFFILNVLGRFKTCCNVWVMYLLIL
jgi:hypothetical protein